MSENETLFKRLRTLGVVLGLIGFGFVAAGYGYGGAAHREDLRPVAVLETFSAIREIVL